jgi:anti-sigma-K factor RskA
MKDVAGLLALASPTVAPPAGLRDRILSDARAVRPISVVAKPAQPAAQAVNPSQRAGRPASPQSGGRLLFTWLAAAAVIVLAVNLGMKGRRERAGRLAAEQALVAARATLDSTRTALATRDSLITSLIAPDVQAVTVSGSGPNPSAKYFLDRRARRIVIAASALRPAAQGRTYQLWGIETGKAPVSLGTFNTDASGRALASVAIPAGLNIAVTAVTDEPSGGSPQPTTTPFLAATWKSE